MCLSTISEKLDKPSALIQSGWKTFAGNARTPLFENFTLQGSKTVPLDRWIKAEGKEVKISSFKKYEAGFHIFEDEEDLKKNSNYTHFGGMRRVYYRYAHTRGMDQGLKVVIAREMCVLSDPDGWPPQEETPRRN